MKKYLAVVLTVVLGATAYAASVKPTSNILGDSEATAQTLVYRDSDNASTLYTLTVSNAITVPAGSIDTTKITGTFIASDLASDCIDSTKVSDGSLYNADISASAAIGTAKISGTWLAANIAANVLGTTKLLAISGTTEDSFILCYTPNGGIGRCTVADGGSDTGKYCTCGAF
jgi:hypothetical protein